MDFSSVLIAINNFSFFVFLAILFSSIKSVERFNNQKPILIASFFMFFSISMLFLELTSFIHESNYTVLLTFLTYSTLVYSVLYVAKLISSLNPKLTEIKPIYIVVYSIFVGALFSIDTLYGSYIIRSYLMLVGLSYPFFLIGRSVILSPVRFYKSPFTYQMVMLVVLYVLKMQNLYSNPSISYTTPAGSDTAYTMFSIIILITLQITYMFEYLQAQNSKLKSNSNILESTLQQAKEDSMIDPLTKLYNRVMLEETLQRYLSVYEESHNEFVIAMIDIRNFKKVNDSYGHRKGDKVLTSIAVQLSNTIRNNDIVGRWGGDEFLIIFPDAKKETSTSLQTKIKENVKFDDLKIPDVLISLSIGFSSITECTTIEELVHLADLRMYLQRNIDIK